MGAGGGAAPFLSGPPVGSAIWLALLELQAHALPHPAPPRPLRRPCGLPAGARHTGGSPLRRARASTPYLGLCRYQQYRLFGYPGQYAAGTPGGRGAGLVPGKAAVESAGRPGARSDYPPPALPAAPGVRCLAHRRFPGARPVLRATAHGGIALPFCRLLPGAPAGGDRPGPGPVGVLGRRRADRPLCRPAAPAHPRPPQPHGQAPRPVGLPSPVPPGGHLLAL